MEVLQKGKPNGWEIEQVCSGNGNGGGGCEAKLLVNTKDIFVTTYTYWDGSKEYYFTFRCPCCGICTDIPKEKIPSGIQRKALEEYQNNIR